MLVYKILKMTKFCHFMTYTYHLNLPRLQNQFLYTQKNYSTYFTECHTTGAKSTGI